MVLECASDRASLRAATTSRMLDAFRDNPPTRQEFLSLIGNPGIHG